MNTRYRRALIYLTIAILAITLIVMYIIAEPATVYDLGKNTVHFALGR